MVNTENLTKVIIEIAHQEHIQKRCYVTELGSPF